MPTGFRKRPGRSWWSSTEHPLRAVVVVVIGSSLSSPLGLYLGSTSSARSRPHPCSAHGRPSHGCDLTWVTFGRSGRRPGLTPCTALHIISRARAAWMDKATLSRARDGEVM